MVRYAPCQVRHLIPHFAQPLISISSRSQQARKSATLQNLSTIATFFSAVTATMIQYSIPLTQSTLALCTNLLWLTSLVLSIGSAINSQFALYWTSSSYRSPTFETPKIIAALISRMPIALLGVSVLFFLLRLVCFTFEIFRSHTVVPALVAACAASVTMTSILIGTWQSGEWSSGKALRQTQGSWLWPGLRSASIRGLFHQITIPGRSLLLLWKRATCRAHPVVPAPATGVPTTSNTGTVAPPISFQITSPLIAPAVIFSADDWQRRLSRIIEPLLPCAHKNYSPSQCGVWGSIVPTAKLSLAPLEIVRISGYYQQTRSPFDRYIFDVSISPDGDSLAVSCDGRLSVWALHAWYSPPKSLAIPISLRRSATIWSQDRRHLLVLGDETLLWDLEVGRLYEA